MKYWIASTALLSSCAVFAQSNVTLSGGMVIGYKHTSALANGTGSRNGIDNLDAGGNHLTFRAREDLGNGYKVDVLLNSRFEPQDGSVARGQPYFTNSKLSISGPFGELAMGRFWAPVDDLLRRVLDPYLPLGLGTSVFGGIFDAPTRYNGTLMYSTPTLGGFKGAFAIVPKSAMTSNKVNTTELALRYLNGPLALGMGLTKNAGPSPSSVNNIEGKDVLTVGGAYDFGFLKAGLTYSGVDAYASVPKSDRWSFGLRAPLTGSTSFKFGYEQQKLKRGPKTDTVAMGVEYMLSKRTMLFTELGKVSSDTPARDETGVTYMLGISHRF